ncbi:MAG TPA: hypothetical protein VGL49_08190 [Acidimicrobiales bacterium]
MHATKTLAVAAAVTAAVLGAGCGTSGSGHAAATPTVPTSVLAPAVTTAPPKAPPSTTPATTPPATAPPATTPPALVVSTPTVQVLADCAKPAYEPSAIVLGCYDGNAELINISWSSWDQDTAVGTTGFRENDCQPNCADGTFHEYSGRLALSGARISPLGPLFSVAVFTFDGTPPPGTSPTWTWPLTVPDTIHNLFINDQTKADLVNAFATVQHLTPNEIQGIAPGSVYYAYDATTNMYWAVATILPSAWYLALPSELQTNFGGGPWVFTKVSAGWNEIAGIGSGCPLPTDVLAVWGKTTATCQFPAP